MDMLNYINKLIKAQTNPEKQREIIHKINDLVIIENGLKVEPEIIGRINKFIESNKKQLASYSGNYLTNTYKRMNEEKDRERKRAYFRRTIKMLEALKNKAEKFTLSKFEKALLVSTFRDEIHDYYVSKYKYEKEINYPVVDPTEFEGRRNWTIKKQKLLAAGDIYNTSDLNCCVGEYAKLLQTQENPEEEKLSKIRMLEKELELCQGEDIHFTPVHVVNRMVELACIDSNSIVLDPSAGTGRIADKLKEVTKNVHCVECYYKFRELLELKGHKLVGSDFLEYCKPNYYDAIVMNPPFSNNQDIQHLKHAYNCLKAGGVLVCITSPHWAFAKDKTSREFREWIEYQDSYNYDLESGTFEMTGVRSKIVVIEKREESELLAV